MNNEVTDAEMQELIDKIYMDEHGKLQDMEPETGVAFCGDNFSCICYKAWDGQSITFSVTKAEPVYYDVKWTQGIEDKIADDLYKGVDEEFDDLWDIVVEGQDFHTIFHPVSDGIDWYTKLGDIEKIDWSIPSYFDA